MLTPSFIYTDFLKMVCLVCQKSVNLVMILILKIGHKDIKILDMDVFDTIFTKDDFSFSFPALS